MPVDRAAPALRAALREARAVLAGLNGHYLTGPTLGMPMEVDVGEVLERIDGALALPHARKARQ